MADSAVSRKSKYPICRVEGRGGPKCCAWDGFVDPDAYSYCSDTLEIRSMLVYRMKPLRRSNTRAFLGCGFKFPARVS